VLGKSGHTWLSSEKKSESASGPGLAGAGLTGLGGSVLEKVGCADGLDGGATGLGGGFFAGASVPVPGTCSCDSWSVTRDSSSARLSCQLVCCGDTCQYPGYYSVLPAPYPALTCHSTPPALSLLPTAWPADSQHLYSVQTAPLTALLYLTSPYSARQPAQCMG
jgi:hypothetical protein